MGASDWTTFAEYTFTEQDLWTSKIASASSKVDFKHVAEAPENLDILPEDFDVLPEEVQSDNEDWSAVTGQNVATGDGWTLVTDE